MTDLELATLDDLWQEIRKRTTAAVLIPLQPTREATTEASRNTYVFHGGFHRYLGLITECQHKLLLPGGDQPNQDPDE